jgi:hypothetical protein
VWACGVGATCTEGGPGDLGSPGSPSPNEDKRCPSASASLNALPHGGGILFSGTAEVGVGAAGATVNGTASLGANNLFVDNDGNVSTGTFVSGDAVAYAGENHVAAAPAQTKVAPPSVVGASAGVGAFFFLTNAQSAYQLSGPFATTNINIGMGPKMSFTFSYDPASKTWLFAVNPPALGLGAGVSGSVVTTSTKVFDFKNSGCH